MSEEAVSGRARGRGGRGRGKPPQQQPAPGSVQPRQGVQQPSKSGATRAEQSAASAGRGRAAARQEPPTIMQQAAPIPAARIPQVEGHTGGRGVHRGGGRERSNPAGDAPIKELARLDIRGTHRERRQPYEKFTDISYKDIEKSSHGTYGNKVEILTNYFKVTLPTDFHIWQYHIDFNPEVENIRVKYALIAGLDAVTGAVKCFDGGILYLTKCLQNEVTECYATRSYDGAVIQIKIRRITEVFWNSPQYIQIVNLLFKKVEIALGMKRIRDHYFNPKLAALTASKEFSVWPGFTTSILKYEAGNLLGVDIIHKVLRTDTLLNGLQNLAKKMERNPAFQVAAARKYVGTIVLTRYNNKTYRVDDIDWEGSPMSTFEKSGERLTYVEYYQKRWNYEIKDKSQPLLVTRPTEKDKRRGDRQNTYLVPELCTVTGLSEEDRADFNVMKDLAVHTRVNPDKRIQTLEEFLRQINASPQIREILKPWQTSFESSALRIPARHYPAEQLLMKTQRGEISKISYISKEADWSRNMRNCTLLNAITMNKWLLIYPRLVSNQANDLADCLHRVGKGMGMQINEPIRVELHNDRNESFLQSIRQNLDQSIQMVVVVAPNNKKDRYDAIKKSCCIDNPVPSQVVLSRTLNKKQSLMSVATKIAIQMNCKMGGEVWAVEIPVRGLMVVGIDSYHDSGQKGQSVGALVVSLNKECTRYYSMTEYHATGNDLLNGITTLLGVALKKYHEVNGALAQKIIFYRDGVGDGQLDYVYNHEKEQVMAAFQSVGGDSYKPGFAYVIVKKRINTRLFGLEHNHVVNPLPGTIVDSHITKPDWYDFFLVSQSVRQGTVSPTSYNVIYDTTGFQVDHMQRLTYKLTHLYFNWQGTIRVPAPCQYAHKLAFLQGQSLHRQFSGLLADKLFYL